MDYRSDGLAFMMLQCFEYIDHWKTYSVQRFLRIDLLRNYHSAWGTCNRGLLLLAYVGMLPRFGETRRLPPHRPYATVTIYWHFVDFVWILIVLLLYVLPHFQARAYGH